MRHVAHDATRISVAGPPAFLLISHEFAAKCCPTPRHLPSGVTAGRDRRRFRGVPARNRTGRGHCSVSDGSTPTDTRATASFIALCSGVRASGKANQLNRLPVELFPAFLFAVQSWLGDTRAYRPLRGHACRCGNANAPACRVVACPVVPAYAGGEPTPRETLEWTYPSSSACPETTNPRRSVWLPSCATRSTPNPC